MTNKSMVVDLVSEFLGFPKSFDQRIVEVEFNCPKCDDGQNKFNLVLNLEKLLYHCWSCEYRGHAKKLIYDYGDSEQQERLKKLLAGMGVVRDKKIYSRNTTFSQDFSSNSFRTMKVVWTDSLHYIAAKRYLNQRKITKEMIDQWDICYADDGPYAGRIIIPSKDTKGKIEYFVARDIYDTAKIKYKNPKVEKSSIIFGEKFIDWKKPVILTEGVFDAMVLYNSVPLLGTKIDGYKRLSQKIISNKTPIILGFDEDKTGKSERIKVARYIKKLGGSLYIITGNRYNDLSSAFICEGRDYLIKLIQSAQPFDELELAIATLEE